MRLVLASGLMAVAVLLAAQPTGGQAAAPPPATAINAPQAEFELVGPNGYSMAVEGRGRKVMLSIVREFPSGTFSVASYATRGTVSQHRIEARFGHFGLVSVRLTRSRRIVRKPPRQCKGNPAIERRGVFSGLIRFRGEEDYVTVVERRALGRSVTYPRRRCGRGNEGRASASRKRRRLEAVELAVSTPGKRVFFHAVGLRESGKRNIPLALLVATKERRGSVAIARFLIEFPERNRAFAVAEDGKTATLRPPQPFHGTASFDRSAPPLERWAGTLSVNLLGASVPLTGPQFRAHLEIDSGRKDRAAAPKPLRP